MKIRPYKQMLRCSIFRIQPARYPDIYFINGLRLKTCVPLKHFRSNICPLVLLSGIIKTNFSLEISGRGVWHDKSIKGLYDHSRLTIALSFILLEETNVRSLVQLRKIIIFLINGGAKTQKTSVQSGWLCVGVVNRFLSRVFGEIHRSEATPWCLPPLHGFSARKLGSLLLYKLPAN